MQRPGVLASWLFVALPAALSVLAGDCLGEEVRVQPIGSASAQVQARIVAALESPTQVDFVDTPLTDAIQYLKDLHKIEIQLDAKALEASGVALDKPVTRNVAGVSLRAALDLILQELALVWTIRDDVLLITTPKALPSRLTTKVYDLSNLVGHDAAAGREVLEIVTTTIHPTSWKAAGGAGSAMVLKAEGLHVLVVAQIEPVHLEVHQLLRILLGAKSSPAPSPPSPAKMPAARS